MMRRRPMAQFHVNEAWSRATKATQIISDMPKGQGAGDGVERAVIALDEAKAALEMIDTELKMLRSWLKPLLAVIDKPMTRTVMEMRYIDGMQPMAIAIEKCYSERRIMQMLESGESTICKLCDIEIKTVEPSMESVSVMRLHAGMTAAEVRLELCKVPPDTKIEWEGER